MPKTYREIAIEDMLPTVEEAMSRVIDWSGNLPLVVSISTAMVAGHTEFAGKNERFAGVKPLAQHLEHLPYRYLESDVPRRDEDVRVFQ